MMSPPGFAGAVLAGGASRRMGTDKALLVLGGRTLVARVVDSLAAAGADPVIIIGGDAEELSAAGHRVVVDDHPGEGPLGAILTAMRALPDAAAIAVLACDLVAPSAPAIEEVVLALWATSADVVVPVVDDQPEWLHAVWRASALNGLRAAFAAGDRAIHTAAERLDVAYHHGLEAADVADADRPEDLHR